MTAEVTMYSTRFCPYCMRARMLLDSKNMSYKDIGVDAEPGLRREMMNLSGRSSVPQIWIGDTHVGGYDEMAALERQGRLEELLKLTPQALQQ
jgi:glutaredoxin 3